MRPMQLRIANSSYWFWPVWITIGICSVTSAQEAPEHPYFPLKIGTKWFYTTSGQMFTIEVVKQENVDEVPCLRLEARVQQNLVATEHLKVDTSGVWRYQINGQKPDKPFPVLMVPISAKPEELNRRWTTNLKIGAESLKGEFRSKRTSFKLGEKEYEDVLQVQAELDVDGQAMKFTFWYARGVGMVRQIVESDGFNMKIELQKMEQPTETSKSK